MRVLSGTSGFSYKEWRGSFYPEDAAPSDLLRLYAERLPAVEINNTFYRMPKSSVVASWAEQVPANFRFVIKASQRITHRQRLRDVDDSVAYLFKVIAILEARLGAVLFQLPPFLKKDVPLLQSFLAVLPPECKPVLEFRHPSWFSDDVYSALSAGKAALCGGDLDAETQAPPLVATTDFGYLRMRREDTSYSEAELDDWASRVAEQRWSQAFVFFKHEVEGPILAEAFNARFSSASGAQPAAPLPPKSDLIPKPPLNTSPERSGRASSVRKALPESDAAAESEGEPGHGSVRPAVEG
ncbi:MAG: DUF72 domain-containing protein [Polyangiaceae bacterium]|nr:DUF72 domain-containing protein [Polyangiaceae bacterium]